MKRVLCIVAVLMANTVLVQAEELPPEVAEIVKSLQQDLEQMRAQMLLAIKEKRDAAIQKLQEVQDQFTRESKLDEALAIRDKIRSLKGVATTGGANPGGVERNGGLNQIEVPGQNIRGFVQRGVFVENGVAFFQDLNVRALGPGVRVPGQRVVKPVVDLVELPRPAAEIVKLLEQESDQIRTKMESEVVAKQEKVVPKLQEIQDKYTRMAKLDEALAIRALIRSLKNPSLTALPDPGSLYEYQNREGQVLTFEVIGAIDGSVWGTEIYTTDSDLSTAAVHSNVLRQGEKGIVKVTILPGQDAYVGTNSQGVTSSSYGRYGGSYKIQGFSGVNAPAVQRVAPAGGQPPNAVFLDVPDSKPVLRQREPKVAVPEGQVEKRFPE